MESTGPTTRSRARAGAPSETSAAPSTRRKPATRSTRKSSVPPAEPTPSKEAPVMQENGNTCIQVEQVDADARNNQEMPTTDADVPPTVAAPDTAPIAGLTPVNATPTAGYPMETPTTMGPSPVLPIKLDSLWSPNVPQQSITTGFAAAPSYTASARPSEAGVDLAALFISTPAPPAAATDAAVSPVEGLVSAEPSAAAVAPDSSSNEPFAEQPFGGFTDAAMAGSPAAAAPQQQQLVASEQAAVGSEQVQHGDAVADERISAGSPTVVAMEDAAVAEMDDNDDQPSAPPMSLGHYPSPAASSPTPTARRSSRSSTAAAVADRSTPGRTPGRAATSPAPVGTPASPFPESDDDMPEAEAEYPEEKAVLAEALADGLAFDTSSQQHAAVGAWAAAADEQQATQGELAAAAGGEEQFSDEDLLHDLPSTEDAEEFMEDTDITAAAAAAAEPPAEVATAGAEQQDQWFSTGAAIEAAPAVDDDSTEAATLGVQDTAIEACNSPPTAAAEAQAETEATPVKESAAPAEAADAAMSPEIMSLAFDAGAAASAGARFTGSQATTAAPAPKSAMAQPKGAASANQKSTGRKSAHVVLPDPSPVKSSLKSSDGKHSMPGSSTSSNNTSSSPGHTPFPTKSKIRAATAAADRAAAAKDVSLKKEIAYARAHSALKHYNSSSKAEQQADEEHSLAAAPGSAGQKSSSGGSSKPVASRLLQPTASSMAKSRTSLTSEIDTHVWSTPEPEASAAAATIAATAGSSKPRLASKVVVPSPVDKQRAEPGIKALKRAIKDKAEKKAKATLAEHHSSSDTQKVHDVNAIRSKKSSKAVQPAPAAAELEFDEEDYDEGYDQDYHAAANELADTMTGLSMGPIRVHQPAGPLKGVAAPTGKHLVFDDAGEAKETPSSKLRAAPKHTYFDEEGNPRSAPPMPRWR